MFLSANCEILSNSIYDAQMLYNTYNDRMTKVLSLTVTNTLGLFSPKLGRGKNTNILYSFSVLTIYR